MKTLTSVLIASMLLSTVSAFAQPGSPDTRFGNNGKKIKPPGRGWAIAIQTDGKIVMGGSRGVNLMVARYLSNGAIDKSFGGKGSTVIDFGGFSEAYSIAIQADGKIIAAGTTWPGGFAIARFKPDGSPDSSFGVNAKVTTDFPGGTAYANFIAIQPDNKIIIIGTIGDDRSIIALARYNADGLLDAGFGNAGILKVHSINHLDQGMAVILQPGGKIVAVGFAYVVTNEGFGGFDFVLVRYNANGKIDKSFGTDGYTFTDINGYDLAMAAAVQHSGKIVVAGYSGIYVSSAIDMARYTKNGLLDSSFGTNGKVTTSVRGVDDNAYSLAIQPDDKIIVVGASSNDSGYNDFFLVRYKPNGKIDETFGTNGIVITDFGMDDDARSVAIQTDGKIVAAGSSGGDLALARYNGDNAVFDNASNENISSLKSTEGNLSVNDIKIYPNPVQSILNIEFNTKGTVQKRISIYDVNGKLVLTKSAAGNTALNVKQLMAGTYFMKITDVDGKLLYSGKLFKE